MEDRAPYLWRILSLLPDLEECVRDLGIEFRQTVPTTRSRQRSRYQMFQILAIAYAKGYRSAVSDVLESFRELASLDLLDDLPKVAGLEGLELAVELGGDLDDWEASWAYEKSVEANGKRATERRLGRLTKTNPNAARFRPRTPKESSEPKRREELSPELVVERILSGTITSKKDLDILETYHWMQLADIALVTDELPVLWQIVNAYRRQKRAFDGDVEKLLEKAKEGPEQRLKKMRQGLLDYTKSAEIRKRGLKMLASDDLNELVDAMDMLERHATAKDLPLWDRALRCTCRNEDYFHWATMSTRHLTFKVPTEMWRFIFARTRCELCRSHIAEKLWRRRELSMVELEELCADSYEYTQKLARRWLSRARKEVKHSGG